MLNRTFRSFNTVAGQAEAGTGRRSLTPSSIPLPPLTAAHNTAILHTFAASLAVITSWFLCVSMYLFLYGVVLLVSSVGLAHIVLSPSLCSPLWDTKGYFAYRYRCSALHLVCVSSGTFLHLLSVNVVTYISLFLAC